MLSATLKGQDLEAERELRVTGDLVQVLQSDGSLRRLPFTPDRCAPDQTRFFYKGRVRTVDTVGGVGGSVEGNQSEGTVTAPMNGQVVKVPVQVGQDVECGEIVLILEAMKMENEVTAPVSGKLAELHVAPGDTVSPGQILFSIEATE